MKFDRPRHIASAAVALVSMVAFWLEGRLDESVEGVLSTEAPIAAKRSSGGSAESTPPDSEENTERRNTVANLGTAWELAAAGDSQTPRQVRDGIPATLMSVDRTLLESLDAGDEAALPIGANTAIVFSIDTRKHYDAHGVTSLKGNVKENGVSLPVVITFGEDSTLATISTRSGTYELRGNTTRAWLYRSRDLGLPGGPVVDYLIPDRETPTAPVSEVAVEVPAGQR